MLGTAGKRYQGSSSILTTISSSKKSMRLASGRISVGRRTASTLSTITQPSSTRLAYSSSSSRLSSPIPTTRPFALRSFSTSQPTLFKNSTIDMTAAVQSTGSAKVIDGNAIAK